MEPIRIFRLACRLYQHCHALPKEVRHRSELKAAAGLVLRNLGHSHVARDRGSRALCLAIAYAGCGECRAWIEGLAAGTTSKDELLGLVGRLERLLYSNNYSVLEAVTGGERYSPEAAPPC